MKPSEVEATHHFMKIYETWCNKCSKNIQHCGGDNL